MENKPGKINILLIDDDPEDADIINHHLKTIYNHTHQLTIYHHLKEAIKAIKEKQFEIILLDLNLPDSSGLETLSGIYELNPGCPIIVLTGLKDEFIGIRAVKKGAQDFLIKSDLTSDILKYSISHSLERYKLLQQLAVNTEKLEQKTSELYNKQKQFEEAQRMAHMGSWEWDIASGTIYWSDELFRIYGLQPQQFTPTTESGLSYIHSSDEERVSPIINNAFRKKIPFSIDYLIVHTNGAERKIYQEAQTISDEHGNISKMYGTVLDITEQLKLEKAANEKKLAEDLAHAKDQFLASISHEIRTPLNGIIGFTKLLLQNGINETHKKQLQAIKSSGDILLVLINDILDISKIESGKLHFEETELILSELINTVYASFEVRLDEKKLRIDYRHDPRVPQILLGDPVRIEQVLLNLINNAFKFTPPGGQITIETKLLNEDEDKAVIEFTVADNGIGIESEKLSIIFEPFVQARNEANRNSEGSGLGLSIVKSLVEAMEGSISVTSKLNKGSTFTIRLPFKKTSATKVSKEAKTILRTAELKEMGRLKILLAEDEMINAFLLQTIFAKTGFQTDTVSTGKGAIDKLNQKDYDIIIMDLMMPEMDGFEAARNIRFKMNPPKSAIPIIALTADVNKQTVIKTSQCGMNDYISKPFNEIELLNKIIRLVKKSRANESVPNLFSMKG